MTNCATLIYTEDDNFEYEWEAFGYITPYIPAKVSGHPDSCYPEEGGELEAVILGLAAVYANDYRYEPLYYHHCHAPRPSNDLVEAALFEALDDQTDYED